MPKQAQKSRIFYGKKSPFSLIWRIATVGFGLKFGDSNTRFAVSELQNQSYRGQQRQCRPRRLQNLTQPRRRDHHPEIPLRNGDRPFRDFLSTVAAK